MKLFMCIFAMGLILMGLLYLIHLKIAAMITLIILIIIECIIVCITIIDITINDN